MKAHAFSILTFGAAALVGGLVVYTVLDLAQIRNRPAGVPPPYRGWLTFR